MEAQGALDSLLGRLSSILVDEARLLGGIRGDVEFIKDEMECMNSLILQITEAQHRDHLVRAWMKQVVGLTRDCEGNVELYIHYVDGGPGGGGVLGYLRRVLRFLRTVPVRHRIATRIQELKVRARDVGDRRQRYGVTVPSASAMAGTDDVEPAGDEEVRRRRRAVLFDSAEPPAWANEEEVATKCIDTLVKWFKREPAPGTTAAATGDDGRQVKLFCIMGGSLAYEVAVRAYENHAVATSFDCKAMSNSWELKSAHATLAKILEEITGVQPGQDCELLSGKEECCGESRSFRTRTMRGDKGS
jgi:hypothetical protein